MGIKTQITNFKLFSKKVLTYDFGYGIVCISDNGSACPISDYNLAPIGFMRSDMWVDVICGSLILLVDFHSLVVSSGSHEERSRR